MNMMMENGIYTLEAMTQMTAVTATAPGWHSILLGVEAEKHNVIMNGEGWIGSNWFQKNGRGTDFKTFLWHAKNEYDLKTMSTLPPIVTWYAELTEEGACDIAMV